MTVCDLGLVSDHARPAAGSHASLSPGRFIRFGRISAVSRPGGWKKQFVAGSFLPSADWR